MLNILNKLLEKEIAREPVAFAVISALKEFVQNGGKITDLTWFQGLGLEKLEQQRDKKAA